MDNDPDLGKLDDLQARIRKASGKVPEKALSPRNESMKMSRVGFDFMGSLLGGALVGWLLDRGLGTKPWIMVALTIVGFIGGVISFWRALTPTSKTE